MVEAQAKMASWIALLIPACVDADTKRHGGRRKESQRCVHGPMSGAAERTRRAQQGGPVATTSIVCESVPGCGCLFVRRVGCHKESRRVVWLLEALWCACALTRRPNFSPQRLVLSEPFEGAVGGGGFRGGSAKLLIVALAARTDGSMKWPVGGFILSLFRRVAGGQRAL